MSPEGAEKEQSKNVSKILVYWISMHKIFNKLKSFRQCHESTLVGMLIVLHNSVLHIGMASKNGVMEKKLKMVTPMC